VFSPEASALVFGSRGEFGSYWSLSQSGFDIEPAKRALSQKLEIVREFLGDDAKPIAKVGLGDEITVRIRVRGLEQDVWNTAIVDLLPAGFEVVMQTESIEESGDEGVSEPSESSGCEGEDCGEGEGGGEGNGEPAESQPAHQPRAGALTIALPGSDFPTDYVDVREDRVVLYGTASTEMQTYLYKIKATNLGTMITPAIHAESMYDRSVRARAEPGKIVVVKP
jgi:uncharacterized protein YfaS (alpha-2-macroglobulin family)